MDITKELPTVIAFCAGYGGIERGLDLAGVKHRVLCYVEIEAFAIANLVSKMESGELVPAPLYTDLKTFPAHLFRDCVDIITGGYPCQPFSAAGKRLGIEDPRHLWPFIRRHIESIRPVRCFFENVEGHISLGLREVIGDLEGAGYQATWGIFSAAEVGAPHHRKRVFIMANAINSGGWDKGGATPDKIWGTASTWGAPLRQRNREELPVWVESASTDVADTDSAGQQPSSWAIPEPEVRDNAWRGGEKLADTISEGLPQRDRQGASTKGQLYAESQCGGGLPPDLADTISAGLQRYFERNRNDEAGQSREIKNGHPTQGDADGGRQTVWPPEPPIRRVVDGCPDRVDRIRLLGNGVVPQTAAKAWTTLNERIKK